MDNYCWFYALTLEPKYNEEVILHQDLVAVWIEELVQKEEQQGTYGQKIYYENANVHSEKMCSYLSILIQTSVMVTTTIVNGFPLGRTLTDL